MLLENSHSMQLTLALTAGLGCGILLGALLFSRRKRPSLAMQREREVNFWLIYNFITMPLSLWIDRWDRYSLASQPVFLFGGGGGGRASGDDCQLSVAHWNACLHTHKKKRLARETRTAINRVVVGCVCADNAVQQHRIRTWPVLLESAGGVLICQSCEIHHVSFLLVHNICTVDQKIFIITKF